MTSFEVLRLVSEALVILGGLGAAGRWLVGYLWRIIRELEEQGKRLDTLNGTVIRHAEDWQSQRELNAWFAGKFGEALPTRKSQVVPGLTHDPKEGC